MKILFLNYDERDACSFYRSAGIAPNLSLQSGAEITISEYKSYSGLKGYDVVMLQRPCTADALFICEEAKRLGVKIIVDHDDNLLAVPKHHTTYEIYQGLERQRSIKGCIKLADMVTVTNKALQDAYMPYNINTIIVPNALMSDKPRRKANDKNTIAWRGGDSHRLDLMSVATAINAATMRYRNWTFAYMGNKPVFLPKYPNVEHILPMSVKDYMEYMYNFAPKVLQVPLVDDDFNRGKSEIAAIESTHCGAACIVPFWWEIPCLRYSTPDEYASVLNALLSGEIDLQAQNDIAWEYIQDNWLLENVNKIRKEIILNL